MVELDKTDMEDFAAFHAQSAGSVGENAAAKFRRQDKVLVAMLLLFLLLLLGMGLLLAIPAVSFVLNFLGINAAFLTPITAWWYEGWHGLLWVLGLGVAALITAVLARHRVLSNAALYAEAGCPRCQEHDLFRVSRYRRDRVLAAFGFPIRRYVCRNCTWHGTRLVGLDPEIAAHMHDPLHMPM
jgi:hypothetical protein